MEELEQLKKEVEERSIRLAVLNERIRIFHELEKEIIHFSPDLFQKLRAIIDPLKK